MRADELLRGFILVSRKANHSDRSFLPPAVVRQPALPALKIKKAYSDFLADTQSEADFRSLLTFMGADDRVKTLLFTYLFQVNDWFGVQEQSTCSQPMSSEGYLGKCATFKS